MAGEYALLSTHYFPCWPLVRPNRRGGGGQRSSVHALSPSLDINDGEDGCSWPTASFLLSFLSYSIRSVERRKRREIEVELLVVALVVARETSS